MHLCTRPEQLISKVITLNAAAVPQSLSCFQLTGTVQIKKLYGFVTTAASFADCHAVQFDLYDSTAAVDLTANTGDLSGLAVGTFFAKTGLAAAAIDIGNNVAGAVVEPGAAGQAFSECQVVQKAAAAATFIRVTYDTTTNPIAATFTIWCEYVGLNGGVLVPV
jgi:hypothetical protein